MISLLYSQLFSSKHFEQRMIQVSDKASSEEDEEDKEDEHVYSSYFVLSNVSTEADKILAAVVSSFDREGRPSG